jgi:hypothetical protein
MASTRSTTPEPPGASAPLRTWSLLVEAAVRCDEQDVARRAVDALCQKTQASPTAWARGVEARSRALVSDGDDAEALYREAIPLLDGSRLRVETARAQLLYGDWLLASIAASMPASSCARRCPTSAQSSLPCSGHGPLGSQGPGVQPGVAPGAIDARSHDHACVPSNPINKGHQAHGLA